MFSKCFPFGISVQIAFRPEGVAHGGENGISAAS
jgi:hypothetical protein